ncbi:protein disulfide isomerase [Schizosaccharomyces cryophilus OY26]|uniref:Protein disulfide isomerase n=1 Tax=Schizosaccharomyces cryophilus (strain OY26 / ATCC MYA-4695 / CBS 11777 / NBRC 106824 / NRRL Y48691) TaxID=653667 RepID=S9VY60_SCHCR|nr:protein disulfide isomerase [Schizosaccharomyces cryophilus OY26]EPY51169.1 protein disulfide isomerase [Schizosaccharomyces cryophilus OY26]
MGLSMGFIKTLVLCLSLYSIVLRGSSLVILTNNTSLKAFEEGKNVNHSLIGASLLDVVTTKEKRLINTEAETSNQLESQLVSYFEEINYDQLHNNVYSSFRQNGFILFTSKDKRCTTCNYYAHNAASAFVKLLKEYKSGIPFYSFDCSSNPWYCQQELGIHTYPTFAYYNLMGEFTFFTSHTPFEVLIKFAETIRPLNNLDGKPHIDSVVRLKELESLESQYPTFFLYIHDYGSTSEDFNYLRMFSRSLAGYAPIFRSDDKNLANYYNITRLPHLMAVRNGVSFSYPAESVSSMRDPIRLCSWAAKLKYPLVPELTPEFAKTLDDDSYLAIALVNPISRHVESQDLHNIQSIGKQWVQTIRSIERNQLLNARKEWWDYVNYLKAKGYEDVPFRAAKHALPLPENNKITFVWLNAHQWKSWISDTFSIKSVPYSRFVLVHPSGLKYWDQSEDGTLLKLDQPARIINTTLSVLSIKGQPPPYNLTVSHEYFWLVQVKEFLASYQKYIWLQAGCFIFVLYWSSVKSLLYRANRSLITYLKQRSPQYLRKSI